jgi:hypothetical protein
MYKEDTALSRFPNGQDEPCPKKRSLTPSDLYHKADSRRSVTCLV